MKKTASASWMRSMRPALIGMLGAALVVTACATVTPVELINARTAYARASTGPAAQLKPAELHKAKGALDAAEASFVEEKGSQKTIDLAYIAERNVEVVESQTRSAQTAQTLEAAKRTYDDKQRALAKNTRAVLADTRVQLTEARKGQAQEAQQLGAEQAARAEANTKAAASEAKAAASDLRANEANDALAKLAAKEDARGQIITLSGGVLFRSNEADLLPAAQTKLDDVAAALISRGRPVVVEGYTDSKGSQSRNRDLSQQRADSVRSYLVLRGFPAEKIIAKGMGPDRPVADNTSAEGRANNRRVEIVVAKSDLPLK